MRAFLNKFRFLLRIKKKLVIVYNSVLFFNAGSVKDVMVMT